MKSESDASLDWHSPKAVLKTAFSQPLYFAGCLLSYRWIRFALVGGASTVTYYLCGLLFVAWLRLPTLAGNGMAYVVAFAVSYLGQARWSFQATASHARLLPKFALAQIFGLILNSVIIESCMRMRMRYELAMLVAIVIVPFITYLLCKFWVFRAQTR